MASFSRKQSFVRKHSHLRRSRSGFEPEVEVLEKVSQRPASPDWSQPRNAPGTSIRLKALPKVSSDVTLRRPLLKEEAEAKARRQEFREGLDGLLAHLDWQIEKRHFDHKKQVWAEQLKVVMSKNYRRSLDMQRRPKPAWTYTDPPGFFSGHLIDPTPSDTYSQTSLDRITAKKSEPVL
eukprot:CAMPEP_0206602496 /NCGR_PEP_ID=MMETSP0325_2-20121206/47444_1 /ASSEMBLY_ACC=CAM_ASM_000347 /TAXON_ID=2866 /ORGANISM="Crypthecodinium cohnii, Strain Seligo" /LENGTH=178 /DNA_ID=CAMNT_0054115039 /DNA_START=116 /DNA_END=649 /DNA_ORIENTATION=-